MLVIPRPLKIHRQPDDVTCGPTCLQAIYAYHGDEISLKDVIAQAPQFPEGGTLAVFLGCHALERGYDATIYTHNVHVFDPTWFGENHRPQVDIGEKLRQQRDSKSNNERLLDATAGYLKFLTMGGRLRMRDLSHELLAEHIVEDGMPLLTGLNATFLYRSARERFEGRVAILDDVAGEVAGHFVVLCGMDSERRRVLVADPLHTNPYAENDHFYWVATEHAIAAILLGIVTYDANLLLVHPKPVV
ncbi:MAG: hypothetical protein RLY93_14950 [Sumerlaeia bacterium]